MRTRIAIAIRNGAPEKRQRRRGRETTGETSVDPGVRAFPLVEGARCGCPCSRAGSTSGTSRRSSPTAAPGSATRSAPSGRSSSCGSCGSACASAATPPTRAPSRAGSRRTSTSGRRSSSWRRCTPGSSWAGTCTRSPTCSWSPPSRAASTAPTSTSRVPGLMTANRGEETLDAMLLKVADLDREIREKALSLPDQILKVVNASLDNTRLGGSFVRILTGRDRALPDGRRGPRPARDRQAPHRRRGEAQPRGLHAAAAEERDPRARAPRPALQGEARPLALLPRAARDRAARRARGARGLRVPLLVAGAGRRETARHLAEPQPGRPHGAGPQGRQRRLDPGRAQRLERGPARRPAHRAQPGPHRRPRRPRLHRRRDGHDRPARRRRPCARCGSRRARRSTSAPTGSPRSPRPRATRAPSPWSSCAPRARPAPEFVARATKLTLASLGLPKRAAALALFALVAIVFFLLPAGRVLDLPWRQPASVAMASDRFWNPGPVMLAHQPIGEKCEACHEVAFQQVRDVACLECHTKIGHHVPQAMKPAALFAGHALRRVPPRPQGREDHAPRRRPVLRRLPPRRALAGERRAVAERGRFREGPSRLPALPARRTRACGASARAAARSRNPRT